jgi:hypothetical protein
VLSDNLCGAAASCYVGQQATVLVYIHRFNKIFTSRSIYETIRRSYMPINAVAYISLHNAANYEWNVRHAGKRNGARQ